MFVIFDRISGEPLIVKISSDRQQRGDIAERAIMLLVSDAEGVEALKRMFGPDTKWNLSRFDIRECIDPLPAFYELKKRTEVSDFCDAAGNLLSEKEIWPYLGIGYRA